jgi:hypothetical protein
VIDRGNHAARCVARDVVHPCRLRG